MTRFRKWQVLRFQTEWKLRSSGSSVLLVWNWHWLLNIAVTMICRVRLDEAWWTVTKASWALTSLGSDRSDHLSDAPTFSLTWEIIKKDHKCRKRVKMEPQCCLLRCICNTPYLLQEANSTFYCLPMNLRRYLKHDHNVISEGKKKNQIWVLNGWWLAEQSSLSDLVPLHYSGWGRVWLRQPQAIRGKRPHQSVCQSLDSTRPADAAILTSAAREGRFSNLFAPWHVA